jgi:hypothetical protein
MPMAAPMKLSQASAYSPISSTQKKRTVGRSNRAEIQVTTQRRKTPASMSTIATSISAVTTTSGAHITARPRTLTRADRRPGRRGLSNDGAAARAVRRREAA